MASIKSGAKHLPLPGVAYLGARPEEILKILFTSGPSTVRRWVVRSTLIRTTASCALALGITKRSSSGSPKTRPSSAGVRSSANLSGSA